MITCWFTVYEISVQAQSFIFDFKGTIHLNTSNCQGITIFSTSFISFFKVIRRIGFFYSQKLIRNHNFNDDIVFLPSFGAESLDDKFLSDEDCRKDFSWCGKKSLLTCFVDFQDLKDYMRQAGEVTYADAHKQHRNEG